MLKPLLLLSALALLVVAPWSAPAAPPQQSAPAPGAKTSAKSSSQSLEKAKAVYKMDCALCHGDNGDGKTDVAKDMELTLVDWTDSKALSNRLDQELFNIIRNGKGKMPAEDKARATDDEVRNLVLYIRGMGKEQPAAAPAAPVASNPPAPNN